MVCDCGATNLKQFQGFEVTVFTDKMEIFKEDDFSMKITIILYQHKTQILYGISILKELFSILQPYIEALYFTGYTALEFEDHLNKVFLYPR